MVSSIARQSVVIKCNLQASIMLGNYEFYYAAGLMHKLTSQMTDQILEPQAMLEEVHRLMDGYQTEDAHELHLMQMLKNYEPTDVLDEQMKELFQEGQTEKYLWEELPPISK